MSCVRAGVGSPSWTRDVRRSVSSWEFWGVWGRRDERD
jgi:hypothetical protein